MLRVCFSCSSTGGHFRSSRFGVQMADDRVVFIGLFDEVCDKFNISVPSTEGNGNGSRSDASDVRAEAWTVDNGGSYGGSSGGGGGGYSGGGGGGSWRSGAGSTVAGDTLLGWMFGGVACVITLGLMF